MSVPIVGSLRRVSEPEPMDTEKVLDQLNVALELQLRSLLQFTQASGSMFGLEVQGVKQNQIDWLRRARRQP